jgi:hypothetical protein
MNHEYYVFVGYASMYSVKCKWEDRKAIFTLGESIPKGEHCGHPANLQQTIQARLSDVHKIVEQIEASHGGLPPEIYLIPV